MGENRRSIRRPLDPHRRCSLGLISLSRLDKSDHDVRITDINHRGIGVLSDHPMEPGLVWFPDGIVDRRGGLLVWSGRQDGLYRAGIRFLPFTEKDEAFLRYWPPCDGTLRSCGELEEFISAWMGGGQERP